MTTQRPQGPVPWRLAALLLLTLAPLGAHPLDEAFVRYDVQLMVLTDGLRVDLFALYGGLVGPSAWQAYQPVRTPLTPADERAWARALADTVILELDGHRLPLRPDWQAFPTPQEFAACETPIPIRCRLDAVVPRGRPARIEVGVRPASLPVLARVLVVAPGAVPMVVTPTAGGVTATLTWPPAGTPPDTRTPRLSAPAWCYLLPGGRSAVPPPVAVPTTREPVVPAPAATAPVPWASLAGLALAALLVWAAGRRVAMKKP